MPRSSSLLLILLLTRLASIQADRQIKDIYSTKLTDPGYYWITSIPEGAKFINVTELSRAVNFLAVKLKNDTYLFNEDYKIVSSGKYKGAGTTFVYLRRNEHNPETFYATGPLNSAIDVMLIYQMHEPRVSYQYELPDDDGHTLAPSIPKKAVTKFLELDKSPTINPESGISENVMMGDETRTSAIPTTSSSAPSKRRRRRKKYIWTSTGFTNCSKPCGGGIQSKKYICITQRTRKHVSSKKCESSLMSKPRAEPIGCNNNPCEPRWEGAPWSKCSVSCGNGTRTRKLHCIKQMLENLKIRVDEQSCAGQSPAGIALEEPCRMPDCDIYVAAIAGIAGGKRTGRWKVEKWSSCSVSCGNGTRTRLVICPSDQTEKLCGSDVKPEVEEVCYMGDCEVTQKPTINGNEIPEALVTTSWLYSAWPDECSATCGSGTMSRRLYCENFTKNDTCDDDRMPIMNKMCIGQQLCGQWFVGPWTKCSSSCDIGMETREVACVTKFLGVLKVVQPTNCQGDPPETTRGCMGPPCNATWFMSDWTRCSRNCGRGFQKREVQCIGPDGVPMNASMMECDEERRPPSRRHCNDFSCNKNKLQEAGGENDVIKDCRDLLTDCWKIRSGNQESRHKCNVEIYRKGCCKACRYLSLPRSNG